MFASTQPIVLSEAEREGLEARSRACGWRASDVNRAKVILMLAEGLPYSEIEVRLDCSPMFISRWRTRFVAERLEGLYGRHRCSAPSAEAQKLEARILSATRRPPPDGSTHWSCRKLAAHLGVPHMRVARVWARAGLQPHRIERYMASNDPDFETKAADVIGLYLDPPEHAVVLCVDEKTAIQALDRLDPVLPLSPGRAERHGFEYYRHGTLSLYAALEVATGRVDGMPAARHTSADFLRFMDQIVTGYRRTQALHVILDNLSAHKTKAVTAWQAAHPNVHFHFTPTYSSWLNQVELWFAKIERDVIARGIFTSVPDLRKKLLRYIKLHNTTARPFTWTYTNPKHRVHAIRNSDAVH